MTSQSSSPTLHPRRILVRGVNWLGDAVMTTPALLRLRERFSEAHLALLTPAKLRDLWQEHPAVNEVIAIEPGDGLVAIGRKCRAGSFDLALALPSSPRAALELWLARIPQRIGYMRPWRNWLLTRAIPTRPGHAKMHKRSAAEVHQLVAADVSRRKKTDDRAVTNAAAMEVRAAHQMHEYLHLVAALGANAEPLAPILAVTPEQVAGAKRKFALDQFTHPILGLNPGAEYGPAKRWPADRFIAAACAIQQRTNCVCLILGGEADAELAARITAGITHHPSRITLNLAGQTSLRELMALLKLCRALLTNDSGPMHVAAALGTPVIVPFGSTAPELTGAGLPGDPRHRLLKSGALCSPCFRRQCPIDFRCMTGISVERVVEAVVETLNR